MTLLLGSLLAILAMLVVGLATAGLSAHGVDGEAVVIAGATLFGAIVGGFITFGVERWRLNADRKERQMTASMVVADSLMDFQKAVDDQVSEAENWAFFEEQMDQYDVRLPRFPLDDDRHWIASLPPTLARQMFTLLRDHRAHNLNCPGLFVLDTLDGRPDPPDDPDRFARPIARFFFWADAIRRDLDAYVGWPPRDVVCPERLEHLRRVAVSEQQL